MTPEVPAGRSRPGGYRLVSAGLWALCTVGSVFGIHEVFARQLDESSWAMGAALGAALAVRSHQPEVDWDAVDRAVVANESSALNIVEVRQHNTSNAPQVVARQMRPAKSTTKGVFVSGDQVLRLSKVAKVPASRFVPAQGARPAGLQVAGVNGYGIGVKDGDVLTQVAGATVTSSAAVISTVLKLRAKRVLAISGEFWRGGERFQITFQMPYLSSAASPSGSEASPSRSGAASLGPSIAGN